ncbi:MAG: threonine/serine exporter family protein [Planctomycetota bacterium]
MIELDELLEDLEDGRCDVPRALERLEEIDASKGRYGAVASAAAFGMSAGCAAVFLGGGLWECLAAAVLGLLLFVLGLLVARSPERVDVSDAWLAFSAGLAGLAWNRWVVPVDYQIVTLSALIILIPGLSFTVAMLELATRHLVSGVARLAGAGATMLTIVLGVALAWRLGNEQLAGTVHRPLSDPVRYAIMAFAPMGFAVLFQVRVREWWVVYLAGLAGFFGSMAGVPILGPNLGPFVGALAVGLVGNTYARIFDRPSSLAHMPGILLLVPGTVGYKALGLFLGDNPMEGTAQAFRMTMVGAALVGGLLTASAILPPRRTL